MSVRSATTPKLQDLAVRAANRIALIDQGHAPATPGSREAAQEILRQVHAELDSRCATVSATAREPARRPAESRLRDDDAMHATARETLLYWHGNVVIAEPATAREVLL